jgi:hypothetical protein
VSIFRFGQLLEWRQKVTVENAGSILQVQVDELVRFEAGGKSKCENTPGTRTREEVYFTQECGYS